MRGRVCIHPALQYCDVNCLVYIIANPLQKTNSAKTNGVQKSQLNGDNVHPPMASSTPNGVTAKVKTSSKMSEGTPDLTLTPSLVDNVELNRNKRKKSSA
jgi:hypothetical protein